MTTLSRILAATALVTVAGCGKLPGASLGGTFGVAPFLGLSIPSEGLSGPAQTYSAALGREYQTMARIAATEDVNWVDASAYYRKGVRALAGEKIDPWAPGALGLGGEAQSLYDEVVSTVNANASRNPVACARSVALYDNYVEELSEGAHSCTDPALVLAELRDALKLCGFSEYVAPPPPPEPEPVPAPVYVEPAPVYVEPAPVYVEPEPAPVYVEPAPVYVEPEPVYVEPTPVPAYPLNYTVYFGYDRCDLTAEASSIVDEAVQAFFAYAAPFMDIVGHTDTRGSKAYNQRLAQCRANAVADAAIAKGVGSGSTRVSAQSELNPALSTGDGVIEALNRRVEITIVQ